ncbi:DNA-processing protein DprA [Candidatus Parcubacteria bacterium]|nr:DNA-processing protein DprA [Patescibacteria group bacterium]MBU4380917.1 DNA-processing protein DprA [Patescibacteria group bacterium]MCG2689434.1 DNA-processing protein DprA [Candidatus Parcubacteria bacterium]
MLEPRQLLKTSNDFPSRLLALADCPQSIDIAGSIVPQDNLSLAIVGSRKMSSYGKEVVQDVARSLAPYQVTVVSGLMYGVDMESHKAALDNNLRTIGVLGFGFNYLYKVPEMALVESIVSKNMGAIISEFKREEAPAPWTFPKRDRIIAALGSVILVVEAGERSGTSYTVGSALQLGKEVLAVPGSIYSEVSIGCHKLIEDGARIVKSTQDVLSALGLTGETAGKTVILNSPLSKEEENVFKFLDQTGLPVDDIIVGCKRPSSTVLSCLVSLEMKGLIKDTGNGVYRKI